MQFIEQGIDLENQEKMWEFYEKFDPDKDPLTPKLNCLSAKAENDAELLSMMESIYIGLNRISDLIITFYIDYFINPEPGDIVDVSVLAATKDIFRRLETLKFRDGLKYYIHLVLFWGCVRNVDELYEYYFPDSTHDHGC